MALTFRIGKIPIRVLPSFFIMAAILGMALPSPVRLAGWIAVVSVSVVVHELGHAAVGRSFGLEPSILLHGMGGTTSWAGSRALSTGKRIAISLAGPIAGFALGALVLVVAFLAGGRPHADRNADAPDLASFVVGQLAYVNFGWGILNLLPMLPLDGGDVMAQVFDAVLGGRGRRPALLVSIALAGVASALALTVRSPWLAILAASFVLTNLRALRDLAAAGRRPG
jgi:Zn-dependent protease